jgi:hypothetical protein
MIQTMIESFLLELWNAPSSMDKVQVLHVFPDLDSEHLKQLFEIYSNDVEAIIAHLLDDPSYPKRQTILQPLWPVIDFLSSTACTPSRDYRRQAPKLLFNTFAFFTLHACSHLIKQADFHFAIAYDRVWTALLPVEDALVTFHGAPLMKTQKQRLTPLFANMLIGRRVFSKRNIRQPIKLLISDPILNDEHAFCQSRTLAQDQAHDNARLRELRHQKAIANQTGWCCQCCFETNIPFIDMVPCQAGEHIFCANCIQTFIHDNVYGNTRVPLACISSDACTAGYDRSALQAVLTPRSLADYDKYEVELQATRAGVPLVTCPKCSTTVTIDDPKIRVLPCPSCLFKSCMDCGEKAHGSVKCGEVEEKTLQGRLSVEEAISAAKIRKCPGCKKVYSECCFTQSFVVIIKNLDKLLLTWSVC